MVQLACAPACGFETAAATNLLIGNRIPKDYFITKGCGESNITIHAGSYHLALKTAGIEMCNIMTYSSILPAIATEIERPQHLYHGSVMETIMAVSSTWITSSFLSCAS